MIGTKTISGLVAPYEWDDQGNPLRVKICSPGEVDYFVAENAMGERLLKMTRQWVEVSGTVLIFEDFKVIDVKEISKQKIGGSL